MAGALVCLAITTAAHGQGNDVIPEPTHPDVTPGIDHGYSRVPVGTKVVVIHH
jgi:hypothetical protein